MIFLDSSVALAFVLSENRRPPPTLWQQPVVASRLLEYEVWTRLHRAGTATTLGPTAEELLLRIQFLELRRDVLARVWQPFPLPVRTLDALHLATVEYLRAQGSAVELASYDKRLLTAAKALGIPIYAL